MVRRDFHNQAQGPGGGLQDLWTTAASVTHIQIQALRRADKGDWRRALSQSPAAPMYPRFQALGHLSEQRTPQKATSSFSLPFSWQTSLGTLATVSS